MTCVEILFWVVGLGLSALSSWFFTAYYYKKSLTMQSDECGKQMASFNAAVLRSEERDTAEMKNQRIQDCLREYKTSGTPVRLIDTYTDLTDGKKADLLDEVLILARGRKAKTNKYRNST